MGVHRDGRSSVLRGRVPNTADTAMTRLGSLGGWDHSTYRRISPAWCLVRLEGLGILLLKRESISLPIFASVTRCLVWDPSPRTKDADLKMDRSLSLFTAVVSDRRRARGLQPIVGD
jgi:hypothetical protein